MRKGLKKISKKWFWILSFLSGQIMPLASLGAEEKLKPITAGGTGLKESAQEAGLNTTGGLPQILGNIIGAFLGILGTVFLVIIIIAGIRWMTSSGNEEQVTKSKNMIIAAFLGIVVIFLSYAIVKFLGTILKSLP